MKIIKGELIAKGKKFALVVSRFNELISSKLVDGAQDALVRHGVKEDEIEVVWVPGAFEITAVCQRLMDKKKYDAIICLGAVIRGSTPHFEYIAAQVSRGVARLSAKGSIPVSFGILTCDTLEQASERAGGKEGNKGTQAALSAIEMLSLYRLI